MITLKEPNKIPYNFAFLLEYTRFNAAVMSDMDPKSAIWDQKGKKR